MDIAATFLSVKENLKENIERLDKTTVKYLHIDIMDGNFVQNKTWTINEMKHLLQNTTKLKDIHLMVEDVKTYVDEYAELNPAFITFHIEAVADVNYMIDYIKSKNIKVGLSFNPTTDFKRIVPYLSQVDLILVMCVEPGSGGQKFIESVEPKIEILKQFREENNYHYLIEVDGGINAETIHKVKTADIVAIGSYITNGNDYQEQLDKLGI